jgi:hypothetical protein
VTNAEKLQMASAFGDMTADVIALRLSRDLFVEQLSATIAERNALGEDVDAISILLDRERDLADALAEALRGVLKALVGVEAPIASPRREAQIAPVVKAARAVLPRHDAARGK